MSRSTPAVGLRRAIRRTWFYGPIVRYLLKPLENLRARARARLTGESGRDWQAAGLDDIRSYWDGRDDEKGDYLLARVAPLAPRSVLEIGANCGNRLVRIARAFPEARLEGIDLNPCAVAFGNAQIPRVEGLHNVLLRQGNAERLEGLGSERYDVVYSFATLIYVGPRRIVGVVRRMYQLATRALVLLEMHDRDAHPPLGEFHLPANWGRNYLRVFEAAGIPVDRVTIDAIPPGVWKPSGGGASCVIVRKGPDARVDQGRR